MTNFETHDRLVIVDGHVIHQTVHVNRITREEDVVTALEERGRRAGALFPYHPYVNILAHTKDAHNEHFMAVVPPRAERISIDVRENRGWPEGLRFLVAMPARVFIISIYDGRLSDARCFFTKQQPHLEAGYTPVLYKSFLPNQQDTGGMCTGAVFRQYRYNGLQSIPEMVLKLINESGYNAHYEHSLTMPPFSGPLPEGFEVPEALREVPYFEQLPEGDYTDYDRRRDLGLNMNTVMLWQFCRWQRWTEDRIMTWQTDVDEIVLGRELGTAAEKWREVVR